MALKLAVKPVRHVVNPDQPPTGVHWFGVSRVGGEVVIEVGFFDINALADEIGQAKPATAEQKEVLLTPRVTVVARYSMAADTFLRLRDSVQYIYEQMKKSGDISLREESENP